MIDPQEELLNLRKSVIELSILNEIAAAISSTMSVDDISEIIISKCLVHLSASQGAIFLSEDSSNKSTEFNTYVRKVTDEKAELPFHFHMSLAGWMNKNKKLLIINSNDENSIFHMLNFTKIGIKSLIATPLLTKSEIIGALVFLNKDDKDGFTEQDGNFLEILGSQCSQTVETARLYKEELKLLEINKELQTARKIQQGFLPKIDSRINTNKLYGINLPAKNVSGDYYDIINLDDGRIFLSIGDVSGKGMPAALLMSNANAIIRSNILGISNPSLTELADTFNKMIYQFSSPEQYITGLFGIYDSKTNIFNYINAGHLPPTIVSNTEVIENEDANLIFGFDPSTVYNINSVKLKNDSALILLTDGITEACDESGDFYGEQKHIEVMRKNLEKPAQEICQAILDSLNKFCLKAEQSDDITIVILKSS